MFPVVESLNVPSILHFNTDITSDVVIILPWHNLHLIGPLYAIKTWWVHVLIPNRFHKQLNINITDCQI